LTSPLRAITVGSPRREPRATHAWGAADVALNHKTQSDRGDPQMKKLLTALAVVSLTASATAGAFEAYTDYTFSKEVWNVTMIKVNPNRIDDYLEGLQKTWQSGCEIGKKMGTVLDCAIYVSDTAANSDFNTILVMKFPSGAYSDPNEAQFKQFQTEMRKQLEEAKQDALVEGYEEMRKFFGEQNFRKIDFK
jgi:hypothetical protein